MPRAQKLPTACHSEHIRFAQCKLCEESRKLQARSFVAYLDSNRNVIQEAAPQDDSEAGGFCTRTCQLWHGVLAMRHVDFIRVSPH